MFDFNLSNEIKLKIRKLLRKDKKKVLIINKKIKEIINSESVERYKNLRYELKEYKRVHIDKHFVLTFKVEKEKDFILFVDFAHHKDVYR
ncbi:hypothetical protein CMO90_02745 [Candidatus Woesearchaeota archaeon]|jgi:YafQ family addiction module toxin component|nr:hypothetical protein [Candidatus Woesearchaeota archaeon]|tara:strand:+ start:4 stop:273 length:270 start_codon:yes stop_codon:yes gene_type:complete